ncbi:class I SAM-dependent methyltransferase [Lachnospiraceae bacterium ZAX-1]
MENAWMNVFEKYIKGQENFVLGKHLSALLQRDPKAMASFFSKYKFIFQMVGASKNVLEVGCNEGYGCFMLSKNATHVVGIDFDKDAIEYAQKAFGADTIDFICDDFLEHDFKGEKFDFIVSTDVIEHIEQAKEDDFLKQICKNLTEHGVAIVSTPNITAFEYASAPSREGHINNYAHERLKKLFDSYFHNTFLFSKNDEMVHTGFYPMAHHLIIMAVGPR